MRRRSRNRLLLLVLVIVVLIGGGVLGFLYLNPHRFVSFNPFTKPEDIIDYSVVEPWDLVVYGTEPEGISAAVAGARSGLKTLLVGEDPELGGLMTLGWLNSLDMSFDVSDGGKLLLTQGIFAEWWDELHRPFSFQIEEAHRAFLRMTAAEANLTVRLSNRLIDLESERTEHGDETLQRLKFLSAEGLEYRVEAPFYIDASADGDLMARTSAPFHRGWEDVGRPGVWMAPTLVFEVKGVNWLEVVQYAQGLNDPRYGANADSAWAYWEIAARYQPKDPQTYLRGLNIGRLGQDVATRENSTVLINALLIFDVDILDADSRARALERGEAEARHVVDFLRREAPGFANAEFVRTAPKLYIRESRHLLGMYTLTLGDVVNEKHFWDEIAVGAYPVDLQAVSPTERERTLYAPVQGYGIPLRCLIPQSGPTNIFLVGRSAAYTSEAHGSARVIPVGMVEGEAAAIAVAYAKNNGISDLRRLAEHRPAVQAIQQEIRSRGGYILPTAE